MIIAETEACEYKSSLNEWREVVESVAAFATAGGGQIHIGIRPDGTEVGVRLGTNTLEDLANHIKQYSEPSQFPSVTYTGPVEHAVITVQVEESPVKPVWAFGRPMKRVGRTNQRLSREEATRLEHLTAGHTWDALPCPGLTWDQVDHAAVRAYLQMTNLSQDTHLTITMQNLRLVTPTGDLTYAAALLFASTPQRFLVEAQVKCARFLGTTGVDFIDEQTYEGTVIQQLDQAIAFIARNSRQAYQFSGQPQRAVIPEYPMAAVREAVVNAICHRDYNEVGTVQVRLYDDRLEVWNPGRLPADLHVEDLYREHHSRPRNPHLALAFYRARLIEHWGTGTLRILQACEIHGLARPEFLLEMGAFIVRFRHGNLQETERSSSPISSRQQMAIAYVRNHGAMTMSEYCTLTQIKKSQAQRDLEAMVRDGVLHRTGKGRATRYVLQSE